MKEYEFDFEGHAVHCYESGAGRPLVLVHGIGPGTSIPANFGGVIDRLGRDRRVIGADFIGFGRSARKRAAPYFDFELWFRQTCRLLDVIGEDAVDVIGHSMGGAMAIRLAAHDRRVRRVVTSGAATGELRLNRAIDTFWTTPRSREDVRAAMKVGMFDHAGITEEIIDERFRVASAPGYAEYFEAMLQGDRQRLLDAASLPVGEVDAMTKPVLLVHGREDAPCPPEQTAYVMHGRLRKGDLYMIANCGHAIPREYPDKFLALARGWLD